MPQRQAQVLAAIALGGASGGLARFAVAEALPTRADHLPWGTLLVNLTGCLLIGVVMVYLLEVLTPHPLARPFLGIGVLGGFTTFSTLALETEQLLDARPLLALVYATASLAGGMLAVYAGASGARRLAGSPPDEDG